MVLFYFDWFDLHGNRSLFFLSIFFYALSVVPYSVANRMLLILGAQHWSLILSIFKASCIGFLLFLLEREFLMISLVGVEVAHSVIYFSLVWIRVGLKSRCSS